MRRKLIGFFIVICTVSGVSAGGYQVGLHGQKQIGMGLIGTSLSMDASAGFYNPAGLSLMPHDYSFLAGASGIFSSTAYQMPHPSLYQTTTDNPIGTPFYLYAAGRITPRLVAGLAINTPFGNSLVWDEQWAGRFLIQEISMRAITLQPTLSYMLTDFLSVGAGFVFAHGSVDLTRALPVQGPDGEASLNINGSTTGIGFNAGLMYAGESGLNVGLSYRSHIDMALDNANAHFYVPASMAGNFPSENQVAVTLPLPANLDFGISYQFNNDLMIGMALNYVFWSAYDTLGFDFATNTAALQDSRNPREYSDRLILRVGAQYSTADIIQLRAGAYFDPTPVNEQYFSPETPGLDNLAFTAGMSVMPTQNLSIDLSFVFIMGLQQDVTYSPEDFAGTYKSRALIPGIGISYNF